jgi:hypothetical protein
MGPLLDDYVESAGPCSLLKGISASWPLQEPTGIQDEEAECTQCLGARDEQGVRGFNQSPPGAPPPVD